MRLTTTDHDRDYDGMHYVYPVVSRRAKGLSIGINLNPNKACNWRCVYCQVPDLVRGAGPEIDLGILKRELATILDDVVHGDFMARMVPADSRRLNDIAFSGDGESTTSPQFLAAIRVAEEALGEFDLTNKTRVILITNGSLVKQKEVQSGLELLAGVGGEVWFKLDRGSDAAIRQTNDVALTMERHLENLRIAAAKAPTWIQTCMFAIDGETPSKQEVEDYLAVLARLKAESLPLKGVLLYGMARPPLLPEATNLSRISEDWMEELGEKIQAIGFDCLVTP